MDDYKKLTNEVSAPVTDNDHSLTAGPRGPVMMQDVWLLEKLAYFDRYNWDFWTILPECFHQVTITMSDSGVPASFRNMHFFGSQTFSFYNEENTRFWCIFSLSNPAGFKKPVR